jgi:hypothetical protein
LGTAAHINLAAAKRWFIVIILAGLGVFAPATSFACQPANPVDLADEACARAVQDALIWTGGYVGMVDGKAGAGTLRSLAVAKSRLKLSEGETLTPDEFKRLLKAADQQKARLGFAVQKLSESGVEIGIPARLVGKPKPESWGTGWQSSDASFRVGALIFDDGRGIDDIAAALKQKEGRVVTYERRRDDWFVMSGDDITGDKFYLRLEGEQTPVRGFSITYPAAREASLTPVVIAIAASFRVTSPSRERDERISAAGTPAVSAPVAAMDDSQRPGVDLRGPRPQVPDPWSSPSAPRDEGDESGEGY